MMSCHNRLQLAPVKNCTLLSAWEQHIMLILLTVIMTIFYLVACFCHYNFVVQRIKPKIQVYDSIINWFATGTPLHGLPK
ncbi:hypothetical protein GDO78_018255 [Eleutherodactylus coqui]|uniref:Uncharacterized protein n=1 Tax=Eleutherodactylus coqui TaxID=57060 RepID=A0A8J6BKT0_ELECQ|nr:hypothetical protein GDO78_018255 [Eleutherodactylus coqui]